MFALYRTDRGRFSLDEIGTDWQPSNKLTIVSWRNADERESAPVAYLCGLLNSELLDLWYGVRGKNPRDVWRNYEPKRMNEMPYRRPDDDPRADEVAERVRSIAANRRALLPHRAYVRNLGRIVKDPWSTGPTELLASELVARLPIAATVSVRLDPTLTLTGDAMATGRTRRTAPDQLTVSRGRAVLASVSGPPHRLDLLEATANGDAPIGSTLLPSDMAQFDARCSAVAAEVNGLLADGRRLVEEVERLVCALYAVPAELTERVIEHAVRRAADPLAQTTQDE